MTEAIEDVSELPGKTVTDQEENPIGEIKEIYAADGEEPAWVGVEAKFGMNDKRMVLIPLARLKDEHGELRVPYSKEHIKNTPQLESDGEIDEEMGRKLRDHFGIDAADQELREDNDGYATLVPDSITAEKVDDPDSLETPDADKTDEETMERLHDSGQSEMRDVDAGAIADEATSDDDDDSDTDDSKPDESDVEGESKESDDESSQGSEDEKEESEQK